MAKKQKKQKWEIVIKDRFLTNEKPDNPYATAFLYFVVFLLSFLLVFVCFFQLCEVQKTSMMNTLKDGDSVLLLRVNSSYKRGDIVVITKKDENGGSTNIIKRIVAVGGDTIRFDIADDGATVLFYLKKGEEQPFRLQEESYIREPMDRTRDGFKHTYEDFEFGKEIKIEKGFFFALGDNRNDSLDSLQDGPYNVANIYAKSVLTIEKNTFLEWVLKLLYHDNNTVDGASVLRPALLR